MHNNTMYDAVNVQLILVFLVVYLGTIVIYGQWKKSKRKLPPGPVGLPIVGYLPFLGHEPHKTLKTLSKKYGNIIGLNLGGRYTVILNEYTVMKETFSHPGSLNRVLHIFEHISPSGFISANGQEWQEQRRFVMRSAKDMGLGQGFWESMILEEVSSFMDELHSYEGSPVRCFHSLNRSLAMNVISLLIGRRLKRGKDDEKVQLFLDFAEVAMEHTGPSKITSLIPKSRKLLEMFRIAGYDRDASIIRMFSKFLKEEIAIHKTKEYRDQPDFINSYIGTTSAISDKYRQYFNESNLEGNIKILFLGGADTLTSFLEWLLSLMALHKDIQERVYHELMSVLGYDGIARYDDRQKIPYTFATLMETQRFSSILRLSTTRCANQDFTIRGYTIPKGADIIANLWALQHDPDYWDEPDTFKPERFLERDERTLVKQPKSYAPFSLGRRNCPGERIAWIGILSYFSEIIRKFKIIVPANEIINFKSSNGIVARLEPQPLCFIKRES